jgi:hypothetical protein
MEEIRSIRRPVRRRKSKMEVFKEAYLPYLILMAAAVLIIIFIIGALIRDGKQQDTPETTQISTVEVAAL